MVSGEAVVRSLKHSKQIRSHDWLGHGTPCLTLPVRRQWHVILMISASPSGTNLHSRSPKSQHIASMGRDRADHADLTGHELGQKLPQRPQNVVQNPWFQHMPKPYRTAVSWVALVRQVASWAWLPATTKLSNLPHHWKANSNLNKIFVHFFGGLDLAKESEVCVSTFMPPLTRPRIHMLSTVK
jgi:hypothetical protein